MLQPDPGARLVKVQSRKIALEGDLLRDAARLALQAEAEDHPLVQAVYSAFPGAQIIDIRTPEALAAEAAAEALPEVDEEWDPFEED